MEVTESSLRAMGRQCYTTIYTIILLRYRDQVVSIHTRRILKLMEAIIMLLLTISYQERMTMDLGTETGSRSTNGRMGIWSLAIFLIRMTVLELSYMARITINLWPTFCLVTRKGIIRLTEFTEN